MKYKNSATVTLNMTAGRRRMADRRRMTDRRRTDSRQTEDGRRTSSGWRTDDGWTADGGRMESRQTAHRWRTQQLILELQSIQISKTAVIITADVADFYDDISIPTLKRVLQERSTHKGSCPGPPVGSISLLM